MLDKNITFKLTKTEWSIHMDRLSLSDCLVDVYEDWEEFKSQPDPEQAIFETTQKAIGEVFDEHKDGSCTVKINLDDKWHVEMFHESIDGSTYPAHLEDELDTHCYPDDVEAIQKQKEAKATIRHMKNINKKLDALGCREIQSRWPF
tara:strand:+ start:64 stop:504 length:441 start_codon:yes stop_codon:yes gene_type:complete